VPEVREIGPERPVALSGEGEVVGLGEAEERYRVTLFPAGSGEIQRRKRTQIMQGSEPVSYVAHAELARAGAFTCSGLM
jgi:hypothetical protein